MEVGEEAEIGRAVRMAFVSRGVETLGGNEPKQCGGESELRGTHPRSEEMQGKNFRRTWQAGTCRAQGSSIELGTENQGQRAGRIVPAGVYGSWRNLYH